MKNLESSYNRSIRIMSDLPLQTHRYLIEPLTGAQHVKFKILKNYLTFIATLRKSSRPVLRQLYLFASNDVRSITGNNLRNILLLNKNLSVHDLEVSDIECLTYQPVPEDSKWKVPFIHDLLNFKHGIVDPPWEMSNDEISELIEVACTS